MVRVVLPAHLRVLANVDREVQLDVTGPVTQQSILDALEARYPMLRGTIRDRTTQKRRPLVRFFACEEDISHDPPDAPLPQAVANGAEAFYIVGAIAGG
jgi:molybdopterin synthase sulfur carrier subunit